MIERGQREPKLLQKALNFQVDCNTTLMVYVISVKAKPILHQNILLVYFI